MARRVLGLALTAAGATAVLGLGIGLAAAPALAAPGATLDAAAGAVLVADATTAPDDINDGRLMKRLQRACDRIPNLLTRSANLQTRLAGDASTRGSLAHLEARIAKARAAGKTDLATALQNRLKVRQDLQEILPARIEQLTKAQSGICVDVAAATGSK
jgi:hypothetical protein